MATEIAPRIVVDPEIQVGRPIVAGTRVPVEVVLGRLSAGISQDEVCEEYDLEREDVLACLAYAARTVADDEVRAVG